MTTTTLDPRIDRLYNLLPAIYRMRDANQQYALQAYLRVIAEQVNVVEDNISQLYADWFIETCEDWVVPYIGQLIGYKPVSSAGILSDDSTAEGRELNQILIPRREVANTIGYRRRKGTLALLDQLAEDIAGWPSHAVEFFKLLAWTQNIDHLHLDRARTVDVRQMGRLDRINGPFDKTAHTVDIRRIDSNRTVGWYNIPSVGLFLWRLKAYSVTGTPASSADSSGSQCYRFSVLGNDAPLFQTEYPSPIPIDEFNRHPERFYGVPGGFSVYAEGWMSLPAGTPIPLSAIVPCDLTDWTYTPAQNQVAIDPVLGRIAFPPAQLPAKGVTVKYFYGFAANLGGGEYDRPIFDPSPRMVSGTEQATQLKYEVGPDQAYKTIGSAIDKWATDNPWDAVIEITDSGLYVESIRLTLQDGHTLQIRAANAKRPVILLSDNQISLPQSLQVTMGERCRFTLDGLLIMGRPVQIIGPSHDPEVDTDPEICGSSLLIRHCTLLPGWEMDCDCQPTNAGKPSLELTNVRAKVRIQHSILGPIRVVENELTYDPIPICLTDSVLDATDTTRVAMNAPNSSWAYAALTVKRSTVFGIVEVHEVDLAENSIFMGCLNVARRQVGCMRFCYVPAGCRTPKRYHCQPDLVIQAVDDETKAGKLQDTLTEDEEVRVTPVFISERYGQPDYARLDLTCAAEIVRGAEDESEMGVYHDLFDPQRAANLLARIADYTPAWMDAGLIFEN